MRWIAERITTILTLVFVALAVAQSGSTATLALGIAVIAIALLVAAQQVGAAAHSREIIVGGRSRQHKESLSDVAAPRHPLTPGRPLSRAPVLALSVA